MKKALAVIAQVVLFFLVFGVFSFLHPLGVHWFVTHPTATVTRYFVADGFLLATALLVLLLIVEAASRGLRAAIPLTVLSFAIAVALGFAAKLGFVTHDLFS